MNALLVLTEHLSARKGDTSPTAEVPTRMPHHPHNPFTLPPPHSASHQPLANRTGRVARRRCPQVLVGKRVLLLHVGGTLRNPGFSLLPFSTSAAGGSGSGKAVSTVDLLLETIAGLAKRSSPGLWVVSTEAFFALPESMQVGGSSARDFQRERSCIKLSGIRLITTHLLATH